MVKGRKSLEFNSALELQKSFVVGRDSQDDLEKKRMRFIARPAGRVKKQPK